MSTTILPSRDTPVVLIGAGIMSATLGVLLKLLQPDLPMTIYERLDRAAAESSDAWNNAGTGHSAFCELNYTPERPDGSVAIEKAIAIAESFEVSKQFWAQLVQEQVLGDPEQFIRQIPHMSLVWGAENRDYLLARSTALQTSSLFQGMHYSTDREQIASWIPLATEGRNPTQILAATHMAIGTDVNFGALTRSLFTFLQAQPNVAIHFNYEVRDLRRAANQHWRIRVAERSTGSEHEDAAAFVFIGAGGGSLPLLLQSGIPESRGYGGFPVSGQWLVCTNPAVIERHRAKVYGKAEVGAPPMSVPHLDTRFIDGRQALFFGPYAGFSTKFLKHGSLLDLPLALRANNILPMLAAGMDNLALTKYLVEQVIQSPEERVRALQAFYPEARSDEWELQVAGQRVQVIKHDEEHGGVLEFGTEVVSAADGRLAALLGASPGASTSVGIMLQVLKRCFPVALATPAWQARLHALIRSYGNPLHADPTLCAAVRARSAAALRLS